MFRSDERDIAVMALPGSPFIITAGPSEPPPYRKGEKKKREREREREWERVERKREREREK